MPKGKTPGSTVVRWRLVLVAAGDADERAKRKR